MNDLKAQTACIRAIVFAVFLQLILFAIIAHHVTRIDKNVEEMADKEIEVTTDAVETELETEITTIAKLDTETIPAKEYVYKKVSEFENLVSSTEEKVTYYDVPLSANLQDYIFKLCEEHDIDPGIVLAMMYHESRYKSGVIGDNGNAFGLMQIQPRWHQERMDRLNCQNLLDPYQNVTVAIDILSELYEKNDSTKWVLMAYNGGYAHANRHIANGTISNYASLVLATSKELTMY